ncbi:MAG: Silent information regulator protein Sir2 [bacterium P3]|nr:MAG: Silent information regulator protein Sir2 [bacterium P3]KWW40730.1 MAG: Silent information regulator protein Sir2 [bacterium F083]
MKKKVVVLTGAGISAESGISTFRDSDGLWERHRVEDVATHEAYLRNPKLVLDFYNERRRQLFAAQPNEAHRQLVRLEAHYEVHIVTQNIDNLHEQAGSSHVLHLHGELTKARSDRDDNLIIDIGDQDIHLGDKAPDGAQLRPHIVWFGEAVPNIEPAAALSEEADVFIVVGTSMNVYPAAGLVHYVPRTAPCYLVDPKAVSVSRPVTAFAEKATTGVKKVVDLLIEEAQGTPEK